MGTALLLSMMVCAAAPAAWSPWNVDGDVVLSGRMAPAGAAVSTRVLLRYRFFAPGSTLRRTSLGEALFKPSSVAVGITGDVTPAFVRGGLALELIPAAVWRIRVGWQGIRYFGNFNHLMRLEGRHADFSPSGLRERAASGHFHTAASAARVLGENLLQGKLGRWVLANQTTADAWTAQRSGYFYLGEYDFPLAGRGELVLRNVAVFGFSPLDRRTMPELTVGVFHMISRALRSGAQNQQAGLAVLQVPIVDAGLLQQVGFTGLFGVQVEDRYRQGNPWAVLQWTVVW